MITSVSSLCILDKSGGASKPRRFYPNAKRERWLLCNIIELW